MSSITIKNLSLYYGDRLTLDNINYTSPHTGSLIGILGPNGAGKTSFIKAVLGLIKTDAEILIDGKDIKKQRHLTAYVPQRKSVDWDFPISALEVVLTGMYHNIGIFKPIRDKHKKIALELLDKVGMADCANRKISELSGGEQQRVFVARALATNAEIYFMDEPLSGVDAVTEKNIINIYNELKAQGKIVISVHHDLHTAPEYFDNIIFLNKQIIAEGETKSVFSGENISLTYSGSITSIASFSSLTEEHKLWIY